MLVCGVDEAGRGPVIGPMVIAIVCVEEDKIESLRKVGVKDSKRLTPEKRAKLFIEIQKIATHIDYVVVSPEEIDQYVRKGKLNLLEAEKTALLIRKVLERGFTYLKFYLDSPDVRPDRYAQTVCSLVKEQVNVAAEHKADSKYTIVSAASIVAKYIRDREIENLKKQYGDFGSGYPSDPRTIKFLLSYVKQHGKLPSIVRKTWSTAQRILREVKQLKLL